MNWLAWLQTALISLSCAEHSDTRPVTPSVPPRAAKAVLIVLITLVPLPAWPQVTVDRAPASEEVWSIVIPRQQIHRSWGYASILFVTNRRIDESEELDLPPSLRGTAVDYDRYLTSKSDTSIALGEACVTVPLGRKPGEQNYETNAEMELPARQFILFRTALLSREDFEAKMMQGQSGDPFDKACPEEADTSPQEPMLYIHGWLTPFTAAMTRAAQLKVDFHRSRLVVLTWPSDKPGGPTTSYDDASAEERVAAKLLPFTLSELKYGFGTYPDVLAHSMGAKLYNDGVALTAETALAVRESSGLSTPAGPRVAFVAPDIDQDAFQAKIADFNRVNAALSVYCTFDIALDLSRLHNGNVRLGFCGTDQTLPKSPEEMIQVKGHIQDTWRHSYFLSAPEMIQDIRDVFSRQPRSPSIPGLQMFDPRILVVH